VCKEDVARPKLLAAHIATPTSRSNFCRASIANKLELRCDARRIGLCTLRHALAAATQKVGVQLDGKGRRIQVFDGICIAACAGGSVLHSNSGSYLALCSAPAFPLNFSAARRHFCCCCCLAHSGWASASFGRQLDA